MNVIKYHNNFLGLMMKSLVFSFKINLQFLGEILWPVCELEDHGDSFWFCNSLKCTR